MSQLLYLRRCYFYFNGFLLVSPKLYESFSKLLSFTPFHVIDEYGVCYEILLQHLATAQQFKVAETRLWYWNCVRAQPEWTQSQNFQQEPGKRHPSPPFIFLIFVCPPLSFSSETWAMETKITFLIQIQMIMQV